MSGLRHCHLALVKLAFKQVWVTFVFSNLPATQLLLDLLIFFFEN